ncbi:uncharacterized protein LOC106665878 [Cimex lectularius]|uniref:ATP synthase F(0) complex subunit e, mitochondrial n=1 Tax=Cimex lectularius TaxID=79782 RepID=A0A8I6RKM0_CIMLE|nr:uncharacterized protein LOC106665878 [Cimex lectularius]
MPRDYKPPINVSPFIRLTRWSLLFAGIMYGMNKQMFYTEVEKMRKSGMDDCEKTGDAEDVNGTPRELAELEKWLSKSSEKKD